MENAWIFDQVVAVQVGLENHAVDNRINLKNSFKELMHKKINNIIQLNERIVQGRLLWLRNIFFDLEYGTVATWV